MKNFIMAVAATLLCSGCALMLHGSSQPVYIDSVPTASQVVVDDVPTQTPAELRLARDRTHTVSARNDRGALVSREIASKPEGLWHLLDFMVCPIVCNVIDVVAGADRELVPASLTIPLPPADAGPEYRSVQAPPPPRKYNTIRHVMGW